VSITVQEAGRAPAPPRRARVLCRRLTAIAWLLAAEVGLIWLWAYVPLSQSPFDFPIYYLGSAAWLRDLDPYEIALLNQTAVALGTAPSPDRYTNPPFLLLLIAPLVPLGPTPAYVVFTAASAACLLLALALAVAIAPRGPAARWWAIGYILAWPVVLSLRLGQVDGLMTVAVALSGWALVRRPRGTAFLAGFPVGLAGGIKLLPLVLLPYFLVTRRWAALVWAVAGLLATVVVPALISGPWLLVSFATHIGYYGQKLSAIDNVSLPGIIARLHYRPTHIWEMQELQADPLPWLLAVAALGLAAALLGGALWAVRRLPPERAYLVLLATVLLAAPIAWDHYVAWLLPFLLVALAETKAPRPRWWLLVVAAALLCVPLGRLPAEWPLLALAPLRSLGLVLILVAVASRSPGGTTISRRPTAALGGHAASR
jgi:hypothetical protein